MILVAATISNSSHLSTLQCYATLAPQEKLICPQDRSNYCIKETVSSSRRECGATLDHPFDEWDGGLCVYRKCGSICTNKTTYFLGRDGLNHSRSTACCESNMCNYGSRSKITRSLQFSIIMILLIIL